MPFFATRFTLSLRFFSASYHRLTFKREILSHKPEEKSTTQMRRSFHVFNQNFTIFPLAHVFPVSRLNSDEIEGSATASPMDRTQLKT